MYECYCEFKIFCLKLKTFHSLAFLKIKSLTFSYKIHYSRPFYLLNLKDRINTFTFRENMLQTIYKVNEYRYLVMSEYI